MEGVKPRGRAERKQRRMNIRRISTAEEPFA
jgi:hypothetical protein